MTVAATTALLRERGPVLARVPPVALGLGLVPLLAANGGYFPLSWGWGTMALAGAAAIVAAARAPSRPTALELVFMGGLTLFAAWSALAMLWSEAPSETPLEVERVFVYIAAALAVKAIVRRDQVPDLLAGAVTAMTGVCAYALATRLFPDHFTTPSFGGNRLSSPVGYWNALGLVAAMAALLAIAFSAHAKSVLARALAGGAIPILLPTLYFTYSRGASLALGLGLLVLIAAEPRRLRVLASMLPLALIGGAVVLDASRSRALTNTHHTLAAATHQGRHVAAAVVVACILAAIASVAVGEIDRRIDVPRTVSRAVAALALVIVVAAIGGAFAHYGSPISVAHRAYRSIASNPPKTHGNLNQRLFSLSNNGRLSQWRVALHAFEQHPLAGIGPGAYEQAWFQHRPGNWKVVDAHNLYLETLAETGVVGMVLLGLALAAPLAAFRRARREPLAAAALAAYVAYLAHSIVDWDWELSGVTLGALLCGGALLAAGRSDSRAGRWRSLPIVLGATITLAAFFGLAGNLAISSARNALQSGNYARAAVDARRARFLAPWSATPLQLLGDAQFRLGQTFEASQTLQTAVSKESRDWTLWLDLARVSGSSTRATALATAERLNPLDPSIAAIGRSLPPPGGDTRP